jgi:hypothetical protein
MRDAAVQRARQTETAAADHDLVRVKPEQRAERWSGRWPACSNILLPKPPAELAVRVVTATSTPAPISPVSARTLPAMPSARTVSGSGVNSSENAA